MDGSFETEEMFFKDVLSKDLGISPICAWMGKWARFGTVGSPHLTIGLHKADHVFFVNPMGDEVAVWIF
jgi:hypothetical protein